MWSRTFIGFFLGFLLTMSVCSAVGQFITQGVDVFLFITYIGGFMVWAGYMTWIYVQDSLKKPVVLSFLLLALSAMVNALFYMEIW